MQFKTRAIVSVLFVALLLMAMPTRLFGTSVTLQNATATFSQLDQGGYAFLASRMINGNFSTTAPEGWAIYDISQPDEWSRTSPQTAVFETASDLGFTAGTDLTFYLYQYYQSSGHTLGRFRLSVTTDNRTTFADGLQTGGDVTANWTVLTPSLAAATNGAILTVQPDGSVLASGPNPATTVYTLTAHTGLTGITGVRLEAMADPSLPTNGPGRYYSNGNFVITEFEMDATATPSVPEPASLVLLGTGLIAVVRKRRK